MYTTPWDVAATTPRSGGGQPSVPVMTREPATAGRRHLVLCSGVPEEFVSVTKTSACQQIAPCGMIKVFELKQDPSSAGFNGL